MQRVPGALPIQEPDGGPYCAAVEGREAITRTISNCYAEPVTLRRAGGERWKRLIADLLIAGIRPETPYRKASR